MNDFSFLGICPVCKEAHPVLSISESPWLWLQPDADLEDYILEPHIAKKGRNWCYGSGTNPVKLKE